MTALSSGLARARGWARVSGPAAIAAVAIALVTLPVRSAGAQSPPAAEVPTAPSCAEPPREDERTKELEAEKDRPTESTLEDDGERRIVKRWNEYDLRLFTFRWQIGTLLDFGNAAQSEASASQIKVKHDAKLRDFRFVLGGKLAVERPVTYSIGLMYDGPTDSWFPRETGVQVAIPELWGNIFVGRTKAGVSLNKLTMGYAVWTMERMPISEATVPVMNDGIKWLGGLPSHRANWNFGYFHNVLPKNPATDQYRDSVVGRIAFLPMLPDHEGALLHIALGYHWGMITDGEARLRARPESSTAPYFLDTGTFPAKMSHVFVPEAYFRKKNLFLGAEYFIDKVIALEVGNPLFHGGEAFAAWTVTGEVRPYIDVGGKTGSVEPNESAFEGDDHGGALELVLHGSYSDFEDKDIHGGRFWRITPEANWYLDSMVCLRVNYGFGVLDRFGTTQITNFFGARLQLLID